VSQQRERELIAAIAQVANGFERVEVIDACANIILNAIRQDHATLASAEERLEELTANMRSALRTAHYRRDGTRNDRRIILPPLRELIPN
jgi:hypothetical protein